MGLVGFFVSRLLGVALGVALGVGVRNAALDAEIRRSAGMVTGVTLFLDDTYVTHDKARVSKNQRETVPAKSPGLFGHRRRRRRAVSVDHCEQHTLGESALSHRPRE